MKNNKNIIETAKRTIIEEASSIKLLADYIDTNFAEIVYKIIESNGRVVVTGVGKSANIAAKIVATLNSTGTPSLFMHAADAIHGDLGMIQKNDIILCISKSGNTPEIKVLLPLLKKGGNTIIAMVSDVKSYLAEKADFIINAHVSREACPHNLAPTNSTTAQLVMGDALAMCLLEQRKFSPQDFAKFHPGGALGKKMYLRVEDMYTSKKAPKVSADDSIRDVIIEISSKRLGAAAVVSESTDLIGIITDGDLRRMLEKSTDINTITAKDIMTKNPKTISSKDMAIDAFELMEKNSITQLAVCDKGKYKGMLHLHDLLKEGIV